MADTTFINSVTLSDEDWFNDLNRLHYTILGDPATLAAARKTIYGDSTTAAAHATTMNPWGSRVVTLTGSAVTFTDIADAGYIGQTVLLIMNAAHTWTDGAVFDVQGGATYTCAAGDQVLLVATAVDAFDVTISPANAAPGGFTTGDVKLTLKTTADSGWVLMDDKTIGNAASGATGRANADTAGLFTLLWDNTADAQCAVSSGRGASAAADFAANKTIALPKALGRALATYGSGSGLTARVLAQTLGTETHILSTAEMPAHTHPQAVDTLLTSGAGVADASAVNFGSTGGTTQSTGGGGAHQNMQPTLFLNTMIKL